jgi:hypothetical protein
VIEVVRYSRLRSSSQVTIRWSAVAVQKRIGENMLVTISGTFWPDCLEPIPGKRRFRTHRRYLSRIAINIGVVAVALPIVALCGAGESQAASCKVWRFDGYTEIKQSDGWTMYFTSYNTKAGSQGEARATKPGPDVPLNGPIKGGVGSGGRDISMHVDWQGRYTAKGTLLGYGSGDYNGRIRSDGYASGTVVASDNNEARWETTRALVCTKP